jgi:hypothetical protein
MPIEAVTRRCMPPRRRWADGSDGVRGRAVVTWISGIRNWIKQGDKQVKGELG